MKRWKNALKKASTDIIAEIPRKCKLFFATRGKKGFYRSIPFTRSTAVLVASAPPKAVRRM